MANKHLIDLIHHNNQHHSKATGTFTAALKDAPFPLPREKELQFDKHLGDPVFETTWYARRVGDDRSADYQAVVVSFVDSVPDGTHPVQYFGDETVTYALVINGRISSYYAHADTLTLTSNRTAGHEHIVGKFTDCKMVQDIDPTQHFLMSGSFDLKHVRIIP
ncbi:hypothetical protein [Pseudomonas sp.]|uniref:hypothetical protein n=1 Tax=Pseudomonas sp. TaxID=306 RepID=UPI003D6F5043